jgi:protein-disulfide isomerase
MDWKSILKLAAGGLALFTLGAFTTAVLIGRVPVSVGVWANRAQIEQVVQEYLLTHPEIIIQMTNRLDSQQAASEQKARDDALFNAGGIPTLVDPKVAYVVGPADAKVTVVEFFDYKCPHCKASLGAVKSLLDSGLKVRVAFIERPILTPESHVAALAAVAARRQEGKYLPFHIALMETPGELSKERILDIARNVGLDAARLERDMAEPAVAESINQSTALANRLHLNGTPTFIVNDRIIVGALQSEELQTMVKALSG